MDLWACICLVELGPRVSRGVQWALECTVRAGRDAFVGRVLRLIVFTQSVIPSAFDIRGLDIWLVNAGNIRLQSGRDERYTFGWKVAPSIWTGRMSRVVCVL